MGEAKRRRARGGQLWRRSSLEDVTAERWFALGPNGEDVALVWEVDADTLQRHPEISNQLGLGDWALTTSTGTGTLIHGPFAGMTEAFDGALKLGAVRFLSQLEMF